MGEKILRIRVTLKGRPIRTFVLNKESMTIGRDPNADLYLDNPGVSREHCRIERHASGAYVVVDAGSANGTLVNESRVTRHYLLNNDVIHISKYSLWVTYDEDRRGDSEERKVASDAEEGTTVLRASELEEMIAGVRRAEEAPLAAAAAAGPVRAGGAGSPAALVTAASRREAASKERRTRVLVGLAIVLAFAAGYLAGSERVHSFWRGVVRPTAEATALPAQ